MAWWKAVAIDLATVAVACGAGVVVLRPWLLAAGPVARLRAARVELETTSEVSLRCARFDVEATGGINLRAGGDLTTSAEAVGVEARSGRIVARANDDVQLLGEQILLNCDRAPAIPEWVTQAPSLVLGERFAGSMGMSSGASPTQTMATRS